MKKKSLNKIIRKSIKILKEQLNLDLIVDNPNNVLDTGDYYYFNMGEIMITSTQLTQAWSSCPEIKFAGVFPGYVLSNDASTPNFGPFTDTSTYNNTFVDDNIPFHCYVWAMEGSYVTGLSNTVCTIETGDWGSPEGGFSPLYGIGINNPAFGESPSSVTNIDSFLSQVQGASEVNPIFCEESSYVPPDDNLADPDCPQISFINLPEEISENPTTLNWTGGCPELPIYSTLIANNAYDTAINVNWEAEGCPNGSGCFIPNTGTHTWNIPCDLVTVGETYYYFIASMAVYDEGYTAQNIYNWGSTPDNDIGVQPDEYPFYRYSNQQFGTILITPEACPEPGCTDPTAFNYNPDATVDDGSCISVIEGCTDPTAFNYDSSANTDNGSCVAVVNGCTDPQSINYNPEATTDDGSCKSLDDYEFPGCNEEDPYLPESFLQYLNSYFAVNFGIPANIDSNQFCREYCNDSDYLSALNAIPLNTAIGENLSAATACDCCDPVLGCTDPDATNYNPDATINDGSCVPEILGCIDPIAINFDSDANTDDESCEYIEGCTDNTAFNYNPEAIIDDGSCEPAISGCTNDEATNYNPEANIDDGSCFIEIFGCTDEIASNYNSEANTDDGSCEYVPGCTDENATIDDGSCILPEDLTCNDFEQSPIGDQDWLCTSCEQGSVPDNMSQLCDCCPVYGCTDDTALNYNEEATVDDGTCTYSVFGCTDTTALNFNDAATDDDGSCEYSPLELDYFCCDQDAVNYGENFEGTQLNIDGYVDTYLMTNPDQELCKNELCDYEGCMDPEAPNYDPEATIDDGSCEKVKFYACGPCKGCIEDPSGPFSSLEECETTGCQPTFETINWSQTAFGSKETFCGRCYLAYPNTQQVAAEYGDLYFNNPEGYLSLPNCDCCCESGVDLAGYFEGTLEIGSTIPPLSATVEEANETGIAPITTFECYDFFSEIPGECERFDNTPQDGQDTACGIYWNCVYYNSSTTIPNDGPGGQNCYMDPEVGLQSYDESAQQMAADVTENGSCCGPPPPPLISGCMDPNALNYDPNANAQAGCSDQNDCEGTWVGVMQAPIYNEQSPNYPTINLVSGTCEYDTGGEDGCDTFNGLPNGEAICDMFFEMEEGDEGYSQLAGLTNNGLCCPNQPIYGCTNDSEAVTNYNPEATIDDGSCEYEFNTDCTNFSILNSEFQSTICYRCENQPDYVDMNCECCIYGCTDSLATNYDSEAIIDDNSCEIPDGIIDPDEDPCYEFDQLPELQQTAVCDAYALNPNIPGMALLIDNGNCCPDNLNERFKQLAGIKK